MRLEGFISRFFGYTIIILLLILLLQGMIYANVGVGDIATNFTTVDLDGNEVSLYDFDGFVILINFFAFW